MFAQKYDSAQLSASLKSINLHGRVSETERSRVLAGLTGPVLLGLGSGVSISAGFGSFGFSVLLDGIENTSGQSLWLSQLIITLCFYHVAWVWARIPLGIGTLPALLLIGPAISFGAAITPDTYLFAGNLLAFCAGIVMFALGISLSAAAALGPDGITALSLAAEKKHGWSIPKANLLWNFLAITAGILLGGNFGIATIIGLFTVPLLIQFFVPRLRLYMATPAPRQAGPATFEATAHEQSQTHVCRSIHLAQLEPITTNIESDKSRLKIPHSCYDIVL